MKLFRRNRKNRKPHSNQARTLAPESLENRRLMAADAFNFEILDDPRALAIQAEVYETVDELAEMVQNQVSPEQFQMAQDLGQPELLFAEIGPQLIQPIVDASDIDGLGQAIGQDQQLGQSLNDMVIMELMGIPEEAPEYVQQMNFFLNELDCQLHLFTDLHDGTTSDALPPQFEQLRLELGDEGFSQWLQDNQQQTGTLSGITEDVIGELDPRALQELDQQEAALNGWLEDWFENNQTEPTVFELPGDTDGDGTVAFNDFLTLSSNFGTVVDSGYLAGDFDLDGTVAFSDFLVLSSNFGTTTTSVGCGCDTSDANNPEDGTEIQDGGEIKIREGSIVFVSDETVNGDADDLKEDAPKGTPIHEGMTSWQDIIDKIKDLPDGSVKGDLVISGHGADGGVGASDSDIDGENLTAEQAAILKKKLGPDARIIVLGCCQADKEDNDNMQRLADMTGVPVVGNQGGVNGWSEW